MHPDARYAGGEGRAGVADSDVPSEVLRVIDAFAGSMDHVEVLLAVHAARTHVFTADEIVAAGHADRVAVGRALGDLETAGIVRGMPDGYRYTASSRDERAIERLWEMYRTRPVTLIRAVYARSAPSQLG
jgi:hypothetical protein